MSIEETNSPKNTKKTKAYAAAANIAANIPRASFTIAEFCARNSIAESHYRNLREAGFGPKEIPLGRRRSITIEAEAKWQAMLSQPGMQDSMKKALRQQRREREERKQQRTDA